MTYSIKVHHKNTPPHSSTQRHDKQCTQPITLGVLHKYANHALTLHKTCSSLDLCMLNSSTKVYFYLQIVFEAIRGKGPLGDTALDDVILRNGACPSIGIHKILNIS